ncbi:MAG: EAL domain-containing protein [Rhodospirillales bacterium]|nr:EAL domain-containing protein [Rhodospirillales bacterium]
MLLKKADAALSFAKAAGGATYRFYTPEMTAQAVKAVALDRDLRQALQRHEFRLHYQPLYDALSERIVGAEALIRWQHPERGFVSPMDFIPLAEARGLIGPIGEWAFNEACRQGQAWRKAGLPNIPIAVNVSPAQLRDRTFINGGARSLRDGKCAPNAGHLEITESGAMERGEETIGMLREFKAMGLGLSVDDFGTGYSSLSHLNRMPIDKLKIDRSFVKGLPGDGDDAAIVTAILDMAKALKLKVVAEGVETRAQFDFLKANGCDKIQGYLFGKPLAPDDFMALARQQRALAA